MIVGRTWSCISRRESLSPQLRRCICFEYSGFYLLLVTVSNKTYDDQMYVKRGGVLTACPFDVVFLARICAALLWCGKA